MIPRFLYLLAFASLAFGASELRAAPKPLKLLFLGDSGHHLPLARFQQLQLVLAERGIDLTYTDRVSDLNLPNLNKYDGLMIFANHTDWSSENEKALLEYVESGKGFVPLHCASFCFIRSQPYIDLVGAQFRSHTTGVFRVKTVSPDHPIMKGYESIASWDETYVHHKHNPKNRTVLEVRTDGDLQEPWTWVRTQGKGRVFYTAWGHDHRTWSHPGFIALVERGTRWACGQSLEELAPYVDRPKMTAFAKDAKPFEYVPATLPFYPPGQRWGTLREPIKKMQKPLPAQESIKHYSTPVDFEIQPFVTEEKLGGGKPICMTWDEQGRLWLALSFDYPNELHKDGEGRDKIVICEDSDGDGVCDKITTFADKMSIPTSMLRIRGGLLVHQAPHTMFLKDTNGDGKADVREVLFTGWGTRDTHAGPSNLRYGFDNWIYGMCGYSGFDGTVNGEKIRFGQGLYRFKIEGDSPKVTKLEFLRSTNNNSWGVAFNEQGELFGSTANGCPLVHMPIPNRYYEKVKGLTPGALQNIVYDNHVEPVVENYRQVDWHGGFTAGAGCAIYTARTYPPEYWNKVAFVSEPTAHLTAALVLQSNGSSYTARYGWNLLAGRDDWAAPIDAQVGPDGHMWLIDWYNIIVQHNPTPQGYKTGKGNAYEIDLRDKKYGRIYRLVYTKAKNEPRMNLKGASKQQLIDTLQHHNLTWRLHAQRLLVEQGQRVEDLQVVQSTSAASANRLKSDTASTRLRAFLDLADSKPSKDSGAMIAAALLEPRNLQDSHLQDAVTIAAAVHDVHFLSAIASQATLSKDAQKVVERVSRHFASNASADSIATLLVALDQSKAADTVSLILSNWASATVSKQTLSLPGSAQTALASLIRKAPGQSRGRLLRLATTWGVKGLESQLADVTKSLVDVVTSTSASETERIDAARQLMEFQPESDEIVRKLLSVVTPGTSARFASDLFDVLANSKARSLGAEIVAKSKSIPVTARPSAMRVVLSRGDSASAFLDAVEKGDLRFDLLSLDQKTALATHPDAKLAERAKKLLAMGGGLPDPNRQKVIDQFHSVLSKTGDVGLGKKVFVQHCAKCHKHGGEGQQIGPDLTGFAVHPKEEILIHVLDPSRSVEGNYKAYTASLLDGKVITGLLASETRTSIELLDAENKRIAIPRDDIEELKESTKSLMPEGFEKQMSAEDLTNLLEFMTQKGKYVPIPLDKVATVVTTKGMFFEDSGQSERLVLRDWSAREFEKVPFLFVDPQGDKYKNAILLYSPNGRKAPTMPKSVTLPCNTPAKAIHLLSGVSGWGFPNGERGSTTMTVRLQYEDGRVEEHALRNGVHFADYIRRVEVPQSVYAFRLQGGQQLRYLKVEPRRSGTIKTIEFVKGSDSSAPIVMAVTVETP